MISFKKNNFFYSYVITFNRQQVMVGRCTVFFQYVQRKKEMKVQFMLLTTNSFSPTFFCFPDPAKAFNHSSFSRSVQLDERHCSFSQPLPTPSTSSLSILWVSLSLCFFSLYCRCRRLLGSFDSTILKFHRTMYCRQQVYRQESNKQCVCVRMRENFKLFLSLSHSSPLERKKKYEEENRKATREREREDRFRSSPSIPLTPSHECTHIPLRTVHMRFILRFSHNN